MSEKEDFVVGGYNFATARDAKQARLEREKAGYFEAKLVKDEPGKLLALYDKILDEKIFTTPVGWEYLQGIQEDLRGMGVEKERIRPIPVYVSFTHKPGDFLARQRLAPVKHERLGGGMVTSLIANIILGILVIAMFVITLNSSNPNILNYKNQVQNEYAAWDQELTERERAVRQKEKELYMEVEAQPEENGKNSD